MLSPAADRMIFEAVRQSAPVVELKLRVVCAWCKELKAEGDPGALTTHTICEPCFARMEREEMNDGHR